MPFAQIRRLAYDQRGNAAMIVGFALLAITGSAGLAVDSIVAISVKSKMQSALDAAGLAAGRVNDSSDAIAEAEKVFNANFALDEDMATLKDLTVTPSSDGDALTLSATAEVPTRIMKVAGFNSLTVSASSVINRMVRQMELALVMDNTGSMDSGDKIGAMKSAASDLVKIVFGSSETHPNLWVSLIPYTATVNVGPQHTSWLAAGDGVFDTVNKPFGTETWKGCVMARKDGYDKTDDPPSVRAFTSYLYASASDNVWPPVHSAQSYGNNGTGPNLGCGPAISSLMQKKTDVLAAISDMDAWYRGGTTGNLGLVWGWRTLSPRWRGLWGGSTPDTMPLNYDDVSDKVVVILTDGQNQFYDNPPAGPDKSDYTAYDRLGKFDGGKYATLSDARKELDKRMASICEAMKADGIIIYTITFGSTPDSAAETLFRNCATKPEYYFDSPTNDQLATVFKTIGLQLSNLRIAH